MKRNSSILIGGAFAALLAALVAHYFAIDPAAATPLMGELSAVLDPGGSFTSVSALNGTYEVLPGGLPSGGIFIYLYAPTPTTLSVDIDGTALPDFATLPVGADSSASGYYRVLNINPSQNPAIWKVGIRAPAAKLASSGFTINIVDNSLNPFQTGSGRRSAPLSVKLGRQRSYVLSVVMSGQGQGTVFSSVPAILCPSNCAHDYGQSTTVTLTPSPASNSTFDGWEGPCSGYQNCVVTLNGTALTATAKFRLTTLAGNPLVSNCPAIDPPTATKMWFSQPYCPTQNVFNDPSPGLSCNQQKYFCCASASGPQGACQPQHVEFPPSCDFDNTHIHMEASGCYIDN